MSAEAQPISAGRFAQALEGLPVENLYSKAQEIQNSIQHLQRSNAQLQEYSDSIKNDTSLDEHVRSEGDRDCIDAINENQVVIDRQLERVNLLKEEVERRGGRWHEGEVKSNGINGGSTNETATQQRPRLTDDELRAQLEEQMGDDEDGGMHL